MTDDLIARMDDVLERYQRGIKVTDAEASNYIHGARAALAVAQREKDEAIARLQAYLHHHPFCPVHLRPPAPCTCGLDANKAEAQYNQAKAQYSQLGAAVSRDLSGSGARRSSSQVEVSAATDEALARLEQEMWMWLDSSDHSPDGPTGPRWIQAWADTLRALQVGVTAASASESKPHAG